jgi:hypothetical protein
MGTDFARFGQRFCTDIGKIRPIYSIRIAILSATAFWTLVLFRFRQMSIRLGPHLQRRSEVFPPCRPDMPDMFRLTTDSEYHLRIAFQCIMHIMAGQNRSGQ